jgi:hypothetical protein
VETEDLPELMREVAAALATLPAEILEREYYPQVSGSWYLGFRFEGRRFRAVFDAKDRACWLERRAKPRFRRHRWEPTTWQWTGPGAEPFPVEELLAAVRREAAGRA